MHIITARKLKIMSNDKLFKVSSNFVPKGDQEQAIKKLVDGINKGFRFQTLLGITGSGKTFTMAKVIEKIQKPALIFSPNKTLAAQLYKEFKAFFPDNNVEFFVSYYDYYQPEAYIPTRDLYIEKTVDINETIQKMRLSAFKSLLTRRDTIVVASVSCIYASGDPEDFSRKNVVLEVGKTISPRELAKTLVDMMYSRAMDLTPGNFRIKGDVFEIFPAYEDGPLRIEFFGDEIDRMEISSYPVGNDFKPIDYIKIFPAKEFITSKDKIESAVVTIREELEQRYNYFINSGKLVEAQRIKNKVQYDIEMLLNVGYCKGIENYSRHFSKRSPGEPPTTLLDYFPDDFVTFIDESHISIPQLNGMYFGDHSRKQSLIDYGFRLPSAFDNRPLKFEEFLERIKKAIFVSATLGEFEIDYSSQVVEQIIRPTGLLDPVIEVHPIKNQIEHLIGEIKKRISNNQRVLVTTLTKKTSEVLTKYLKELGLKVMYLHSDIDTPQRSEILRDLRKGEYDVVVGINLLREGLDLPEVSLVAILDADKQGFLRSKRSLMQTAGRAARNSNGKVIFYADTITESMQYVIDVTSKRRKIQKDFNEKHGIIPKSIAKPIEDDIFAQFRDDVKVKENKDQIDTEIENIDIKKLKSQMKKLASELRFEEAAILRDKIKEYEKRKND
jgi:excinuclease ABC subunit B